MNDDFEDLEMDMDYGSDQVMEEPVQRSIKSKTPQKSSGSNAGNRKNLFFRSTIGPERTEKLSIGDKTPVSDLKETIGNMFGLAPEDFHLSHAGRTLNEDAVPKDYSIDNGDELLLIPHSTAGSEYMINEIEADAEEEEVIKSKQPSEQFVQEEVYSKTPAKTTVGKKLNVYFKSTIGAEKTEKLQVGDQTQFSDIKETLNNMFGLDSPDYNLSHAGRVLNDDSTPKDYSVENNDEILLIPFSTAGADDDFEDFDFDEDINSGGSTATATVQIKSKTPQVAKNPVTSNSAGSLKTIFFRSTVGPDKTEKLAVGENAPIRDIKETLGNLFSLDPSDFHLSHAGRTMNEDASPADYSIDNGDEVLLIPHSTAGVL
jgi:molybdopterin converting factor small subunit